MKLKLVSFLLFLLCSTIHCNTQDIIVTNDGKSFKAYKVDTTPEEYVYYQLEDNENALLQKLAKKEIMIIRFEDGRKYDPCSASNTTTTPNIPVSPESEEDRFPAIDLSDFHGFLLDEGNCVYVAQNTPSQSFEKYAVERIKEKIREIGYWNVVDKPEQAHFILQYGVCLKGQDRGFFYLRTRESYQKFPICVYDIWVYKVSEPESMLYTVMFAGEDESDNIKAAELAFSNKIWNKWNKKLNNQKIKTGQDKKFKMFYKE